ncbi:MAG: mechanosensitive ion channel protein MscS [Elusimicrobia bacterium CG08_land_8_20_14_0_20_44_26]|nr:MAG: mechanosensitive ion channel protein MscS [Elusimicrobia bacterium CG08_land_8_20_14_0_20_44_26]
MNIILSKTFLGNSIQSYLIFAVIFAGGIVILKIIKRVLISRMGKLRAKIKTKYYDAILDILSKKVFPLLYFGVFYIGINTLNLSGKFAKVIRHIGIAVFTVYATMRVIEVLIFFIKKVASKRTRGEKEAGLGGLIGSVKFIVWSVAGLFLLDNLGFKVSTILAGMGIGGIAIALAAQTVLGDLFSYFAIFFDRPFGVGDFIVVGDMMGVVESIGIKTTRIKSLSGEQLILSNNDITSSRLRNYKMMERRRVVFKIGVTYETPVQKLKEIPAVIEEIIKGIEGTAFDRAHFASYGAFSLDFEIVYYIIGGDYNKYMDIQQNINFSIKEEFEKRKIDFAYPTQIVYINKNQ